MRQSIGIAAFGTAIGIPIWMAGAFGCVLFLAGVAVGGLAFGSKGALAGGIATLFGIAALS